MHKIFGAVLLAAGASQAFGEAPPLPPWQTVCQAMESETLDHLFMGDECKSRFYDVYNANDVETTHAWMLGNQTCFKEWAHFAWIAFAAADEKMADLAWQQQLYLASQRVGAASACTSRSCIVSDIAALLAAGETATIGSAAAEHTQTFLDVVERNTAFQPQMEKALASVRPLCLLHFNIECIGAMTTALNWMYPRSYRLNPSESMTFSMLAATREVFTDTLTQQYASQLAGYLLRAVESGEYRDTSREALYPLAARFFAYDYDRLWKFLTVYATRGAAWATGYQMVSGDNRPLFAAMMVVAGAMGVIDTYYDSEGKSWSYAAASGNTCFQPKPYHYWMAGSFTYLLKKEGYSTRTATEVARLLGALYEIGSTTMGRSPDAVFFVPTYDPQVNRARREVAHHVLGSFAGSDPETPDPPAFDGMLSRLINASTPLPDYTDDEMRAKIADPKARWQLWTKLTGFYETFGD